MHLKTFLKLIIIIAGLTTGFLALPTYAQTDTNFTPLNPLDNLEVKIPGLDALAQKNPATCSIDSNNETSCKIPWISIYITAIYNYGMAIIGILAAIGMMIGGVLWTISSGNASRVKEAQSWVESSLLGLLLALGSYMILDQINPSLTTFKPIKLNIIQEIPIDSTEAVNTGNLNIDPATWKKIPADDTIIDNTGGKLSGPQTIAGLLKAGECMKQLGYKISVTSASRSLDEQKTIYNQRYQTPNACNHDLRDEYKGAPACCPFGGGTCPHTSGAALDLWGMDGSGNRTKTTQQAVQNCMEQAGFCLLNAECWHFELPQLSSGCSASGNNLNGKYCAGLK